ncbi:MAG: type II toxin-antitoxin system VapC family toxin [Bacteroidia bacterium]|nr:type II toxin-antitoxin system VapC family toxin [Bacteroidia bacterium]
MKLYLDTSAIFKAFHNEQGTGTVIKLLSQQNVSVWISELTKIEFKSALYRRFNNKQISEENLQIAFTGFNDYLINISAVPLNTITLSEAENVFLKFHNSGLRTLDALQLATYMLLSDKELHFVSADDKLCQIIEMTGNKAINPISYNFPDIK